MLRKPLLFGYVLIMALTGCSNNQGGATSESSQVQEAQPISVLVGSKTAKVIRAGDFTDAKRPTTGKAELVQAGDRYHVILNPEFSTLKGPDLQLVLHRSSDLNAQLESPTFPLQETDYVVLGKLKSLNGQQTYAVPEDFKVEDFGSVAIWCEKFNSTFGSANLGQ